MDMDSNSQLILMSPNQKNSLITDALVLANFFQSAALQFNMRQIRKALFAYDIEPDNDNDIHVTLRYALQCIDYPKPYYALPVTDDGSYNIAVAPLHLLDTSTELHRNFIRDVFLFVQDGGMHIMLKNHIPFPIAPEPKYIASVLADLMASVGLPNYYHNVHDINAVNPIEHRSLNCLVGKETNTLLADVGVLFEKQNEMFMKHNTLATAYLSAKGPSAQFLEYAGSNLQFARQNVPANCVTLFNKNTDTFSFNDALSDGINAQARKMLESYQVPLHGISLRTNSVV